MVWGLEKLWASGSSTQSSKPASEPSPFVPDSKAPVATATVPDDARPEATAATTTTLSPAAMERLKEEEGRSILSTRSQKQFGIFAAGAIFLLLSTRMAQRHVAQRVLARPPQFKHNNLGSDISVNGPADAMAALGVATANAFSFTMMMTGGLLWAFDISGVNDLRRKIKGGLGLDVAGKPASKDEEEFEEWLATVLSRKKAREEEAKKKLGLADNEDIRAHWESERAKSRGT